MICPECGNEYTGEKCRLCESLSIQRSIAEATGSGGFLAVCILLTVASALSLLSCTIPFLPLLGAIFCWIVYGNGSNGCFNGRLVRLLSGLCFTWFIVMWVIVGLLMLVGVMDTSLVVDVLKAALLQAGTDPKLEALLTMGDRLLTVIRYVCLAMAAGYTLINIFGVRTIHRFVKSVYLCDEAFTEKPKKVKPAFVWFIVFGVMEALKGIAELTDGNAWGALVGLCIASALFCAAYVIKTYFMSRRTEGQ